MEKDNSQDKNLIPDISKLPISDVLDSLNISFLEQIGSVRYYTFNENDQLNVKMLAVNTKRNQWIDKDTGRTGQLRLMLKEIGHSLTFKENNISKHMQDFYEAQIHSSQFFPTVPIRHGKLNTMLVNRNAAYGKMAKLGLSGVTLSNYCSEMLIIDKATGKEDVQIAFPCDNHEFYLFNGSTLRPLDDPSITTFGTKRKGQNCYIYENALDFLAMSEIQHRNRADYFHKKDYHLIINGRQNLEQACRFIHDNPDFQEVFSFMPINEDGKEIYKELNKTIKGTLIDCSKLYDGNASLIGKIQLHVPSWFVNEYKKIQREKIHKEEKIDPELQKKGVTRTPSKEVKQKPTYGPTQTIKLEGNGKSKPRKRNL